MSNQPGAESGRLWRSWASGQYNQLMNWLLPRRCLLCGASADVSHLCTGCKADLPRIELACPQCGVSVQTEGLCAACLQHPPPFASTIAPLAYAGSVRYLLTQFKFNGRLSHGVPLRVVLHEAVDERDMTKPQALIPVPIHPKRLAERGFNQAVELAMPLARELQIPVLLNAVQRQRATAPQFQLSGDERVANVRGAFVLRAGTLLPKHVAIVDDVLTTGATVRELAKLLRKHGCERVEVWCVARTLAGE